MNGFPVRSAALSVVVCVVACLGSSAAAPALVPMPQHAVWKEGVTPVAEPKFVREASVPSEGYELVVDERGATVKSSDEAGAYYARVTLRQLAEFGGNGKGWPRCEIRDAPRFPWRGLMLDVTTGFFDVPALERLMDQMAYYKLNVLHLHLTDSPAWRYDVPGYPKLVKDWLWNNPGEYAPADIAKLREIAAKRHIRLVPEIEMPGHSGTALRCYPSFFCENLPEKPNKTAYCPGNDEVLKFLDVATDTLAELFPDSYIHLGGDEVNRCNWERCPKCAARLEAEKLSTLADLEHWVVDRMARRLSVRGRKTIVWDEALSPTLPKDVTVLSWQGVAPGIRAATNGYKTVMGSYSCCYFDYAQKIPADPVDYGCYSWTQGTTLRDMYVFDPLALIPAAYHQNLIGIQGQNWGVHGSATLEWRCWPRGIALAEVAWTYPAKRDFAEFLDRLDAHRAHLRAQGVNVATHRMADVSKEGAAAKEVVQKDGIVTVPCDFAPGGEEASAVFRYDHPVSTDRIRLQVKAPAPVTVRFCGTAGTSVALELPTVGTNGWKKVDQKLPAAFACNRIVVTAKKAAGATDGRLQVRKLDTDGNSVNGLAE